MDKYDVGIIGAGIAGSCLAILLGKQGKRVVVFEKESYPKHKVCGEFISLESYEFFQQLGLPLSQWKLPIINNLQLTSQKGGVFKHPLKMGGFGLSRQKLDYELTKQFRGYDITFHPKTKVMSVQNNIIQFEGNQVHADIIIGAHGKYAANYIHRRHNSSSKNYIGVKYHIQGDFNPEIISLHSFDGGYCGISKIEEDKYCLCYLCDSELLKKNSNSIRDLERNVLSKNLHLKLVLEQAVHVWDKPLVISNIKFDKQALTDINMLFAGDAAGSISPLSGNGMSIAAKTALLLSEIMANHSDFNTVSRLYRKTWNASFKSKVSRAKLLNRIMLNPAVHHNVLKIFNLFPFVGSHIINSMQGKPFHVRN